MRIEVIQGDITKRRIDVIVNAANSSLLGGGGVDGAIHRAGGSAILEECRRVRAAHGECATGDAVITGAGNLDAKFVVHAVGPVWRGGARGEDRLLRSCYERSLSLAEEAGARSIAFPNISTGVYGFPKERAARIVKTFFNDRLTRPSSIELVELVAFDGENYRLYLNLFGEGERGNRSV